MADEEQRARVAILRRKDGDYTLEAAAERRAFLPSARGWSSENAASPERRDNAERYP